MIATIFMIRNESFQIFFKFRPQAPDRSRLFSCWNPHTAFIKGDPSLRTSITRSSSIRKYCQAPHGARTWISRQTTGLSGTFRSPWITSLNIRSISFGSHSWVRILITLMNTTCVPVKRMRSVKNPGVRELFRTVPLPVAILPASSIAFFGFGPWVMPHTLRRVDSVSYTHLRAHETPEHLV